MRYRIYLGKQTAIEVTASDLRVVGRRRVTAAPSAIDNRTTVDIDFGDDITSIVDDHDRAVYEQ